MNSTLTAPAPRGWFNEKILLGMSAREADLYKRDAVDTFDDLDPGGGGHDSRPSSKNRRKRK